MHSSFPPAPLALDHHYPVDHSSSHVEPGSGHCIRITVLVLGIISTLIGLLALLHAYDVVPLGDCMIGNFGISVGYPLGGVGILSLFLSTLDCCVPGCSYPEVHHEKMVDVMVSHVLPACTPQAEVSICFELTAGAAKLVLKEPLKEKMVRNQLLEWCSHNLMSEHRGVLNYQVSATKAGQNVFTQKYTYRL